MENKYNITDAELEIMQILWKNKSMGLSDIVIELDKIKARNKNTVKTLIYRLVDKGTVKIQKTQSKGFLYKANISEKKFLSKENNTFLKKLYHGSTEKLLLNFIEEKKVSKEDLKRLLDIIEGEE